MQTRIIEWQLAVQLEDGSFAVFWLDIQPDGLTRYYDERGDRTMRELQGPAAVLHLIDRLGHGDVSAREHRHRSCEFSGEFMLPRQLIAQLEASTPPPSGSMSGRRIRESLAAIIRHHFMRQAAPTLRHHRFAASHPLA